MPGKFRVPRRSAPIILSVIALVFALAGGAVAAKKLSLGALSTSAKNKTVGVGKLIYVTTQQTFNETPQPVDGYKLTANCPGGLSALAGGTKLVSPNYDESSFVLYSDYPSSQGFTSHFNAGSAVTPNTIQVTAVCARSRAVTGTPPTP